MMLNQTNEKPDEEETNENGKETGVVQEESVALYGSRGIAYGAGHPLLYTQFQLNLVHEKRDQIVLLKVRQDIVSY